MIKRLAKSISRSAKMINKSQLGFSKTVNIPPQLEEVLKCLWKAFPRYMVWTILPGWSPNSFKRNKHDKILHVILKFYQHWDVCWTRKEWEVKDQNNPKMESFHLFALETRKWSVAPPFLHFNGLCFSETLLSMC